MRIFSTMVLQTMQQGLSPAQDDSGDLTAAQRIHAANIAAQDTALCPPRPEGARYMGHFSAPAIEVVRVAAIGLGEERGMPQMKLFAHIPHCEVVAVCDLYEDVTRELADFLEQATGKRPAQYYGTPEAYLHMLQEVRPDAVFINTPWETHAQNAIEAMEHGAHAFVEVPLAATLEDLWRVVDTAERTQRHCMMLENVNYGREELLFLNMVRQGLIGELIHGEAAYLHDLRKQMLDEGRGCGSWRTAHYAARNGNLYPTHGLGPIAQYMNIARTEDTFDRLVSLGTPSLGRAAYAQKHLPADHKWNNTRFHCADMNNTLIQTKAGRTILVQWDETTPAPYDRRNLIRGTEGALAGYPLRVAGEKLSPGHSYTDAYGKQRESWYVWQQGDDVAQALYAQYEHPLYTRMSARAQAHGGMNYILLSRIIECLHQGTPLDQNVYEGALWSAVAPLSEKSVHEGGMPQRFPDFTRGDWKTTPPLPIIH